MSYYCCVSTLNNNQIIITNNNNKKTELLSNKIKFNGIRNLIFHNAMFQNTESSHCNMIIALCLDFFEHFIMK